MNHLTEQLRCALHLIPGARLIPERVVIPMPPVYMCHTIDGHKMDYPQWRQTCPACGEVHYASGSESANCVIAQSCSKCGVMWDTPPGVPVAWYDDDSAGRDAPGAEWNPVSSDWAKIGKRALSAGYDAVMALPEENR